MNSSVKILPNIINKNIYKIFPSKIKNKIKPDNKTVNIVTYGSNLNSSLNKKYSNLVINLIEIPNNILYIFTGLILSGAKLEYCSKLNLDKSIFNNNKISYDKSGLLTKSSCRLKMKAKPQQFEYI